MGYHTVVNDISFEIKMRYSITCDDVIFNEHEHVARIKTWDIVSVSHGNNISYGIKMRYCIICEQHSYNMK